MSAIPLCLWSATPGCVVKYNVSSPPSIFDRKSENSIFVFSPFPNWARLSERISTSTIQLPHSSLRSHNYKNHPVRLVPTVSTDCPNAVNPIP
eukprot:m.10534 g.10534  ORF g.10534 m.10534 type:complete len:93 (-) comp4277_c0_seq2:114-392(-)